MQGHAVGRVSVRPALGSVLYMLHAYVPTHGLHRVHAAATEMYLSQE
jgi:hypothetical protein